MLGGSLTSRGAGTSWVCFGHASLGGKLSYYHVKLITLACKLYVWASAGSGDISRWLQLHTAGAG